MRSIRWSVLGALIAVGMIGAVACGSSDESGPGPTSVRLQAPDFSIPVVRTVDADSFQAAQFTLSEERGRPLVLYFSFPG